MARGKSDWVGKYVCENRYQILGKLGEGGMGVVYRARDRRLGADVVIKVPRVAGLLEDSDLRARFLREVRSLVTLSHPHVVAILDVGQQDGVLFAVMPYLPGGSLQDQRKAALDGRAVPWRVEQLEGWLEDVAKALDFIHTQGYVHRDVKPGNILFDQYGNVYLSDFGITKALATEGQQRATTLTQAGMALGTPEYMAPEVILAETYDGRADQYALAVMVYELLTGANPFQAPTPTAVLVRQARETPPQLVTCLPGLPSSTSNAVSRALVKEPRERFPTCLEFVQSLFEGKSLPQDKLALVSARNSKAVSRPKPLLRRLSRYTGGLTLFTSALVLAMILMLISSTHRSPSKVNETASLSDTNGRKSQTPVAPNGSGMAISPKLTQDLYASHLGSSLGLTNSIGMKLVLIPPGEFDMGSKDSENDAKSDEKPQHHVRLTKAFYMGTHEVTRGEYVRIMGTGRSNTENGSQVPIDLVSWHNAVEFCRLLSGLPEEKTARRVYRLPTEAEWEYACRAQTLSRYSFDDEHANSGDYAWYGDNSQHQVHPVGHKTPNAWRLYDMYGNVCEWCADWYDANYYAKSSVDNPPGPDSGTARVLRGGSFYNRLGDMRSAARGWKVPVALRSGTGFRIVCPVPTN